MYNIRLANTQLSRTQFQLKKGVEERRKEYSTVGVTRISRRN